MIQYAIFTFGLIFTIWRIVSSLAWTLDAIKEKSRSVLKYRLSACFECLVLGLIFLGGSLFADMSHFWFILGIIFIGLSVYSSVITLIAFKVGKLETRAFLDEYLKHHLKMKKVIRTLSHLMLLLLWVYSWRYLFV